MRSPRETGERTLNSLQCNRRTYLESFGATEERGTDLKSFGATEERRTYLQIPSTAAEQACEVRIAGSDFRLFIV